jgi:hypothetical protein
VAIREYLEIDQRIKVLNERCRVFLDLAEILSDSIADSKMSSITWIIIVLIVVSILVTVTEVALRFGILEKEKSRNGNFTGAAASLPRVSTAQQDRELKREAGLERLYEELTRANVSMDQLQRWNVLLGQEAMEAVGVEELGELPLS